MARSTSGPAAQPATAASTRTAHASADAPPPRLQRHRVRRRLAARLRRDLRGPGLRGRPVGRRRRGGQLEHTAVWLARCSPHACDSPTASPYRSRGRDAFAAPETELEDESTAPASSRRAWASPAHSPSAGTSSATAARRRHPRARHRRRGHGRAAIPRAGRCHEGEHSASAGPPDAAILERLRPELFRALTAAAVGAARPALRALLPVGRNRALTVEAGAAHETVELSLDAGAGGRRATSGRWRCWRNCERARTGTRRWRRTGRAWWWWRGSCCVCPQPPTRAWTEARRRRSSGWRASSP